MKANTLERQETLTYKKGVPVELKQKPGIVYVIEEYDEMMVPPIWLANDPKPHYPDELNLMSNLFCVLPFRRLQVA